MNDFRFALRQLRNSPGFTFVAVLTLALGIGASTAIVSVLDAVLLRPLPYPAQERLVEVRELSDAGRGMPFAQPNFDDFATRNRSFEAIASYGSGPEAIAGGIEPIRTNACAASADFFRVLGIRPAIGRFFSPETKSDEGVVVSYGFWKRSLGGRTNLEGTSLRLENHSFAVIGVMPPQMEFPPGVEVWFPNAIYPSNDSRTAHNFRVIGRLRAGVSYEQADGEAAAIGRALKATHGSQTDASSFGLMPLRERFVRDIRGILFVLCGAVGLLLAIACSNVANLLLVRATARRKEVALRAALGASRARLARQFIAEALLLTLSAGALGALLAQWSVQLIVNLYHGDLPRVSEIGVNTNVLLFTFAISLLIAVVLGLVPILRASRRQLQADLQDAGRGTSGSHTRARNFLVVSQVALTLMLLVGAGLLGRSFQRLLAVNPGFQTESAVAMSVSQTHPETPADLRKLALLYQRLLERFRALPGAVAVGGINSLPMTNEGVNGTFIIENGAEPSKTLADLDKEFSALAGSGRLGDADFRVASAGYFTAMRIPLLRGRYFAEADGPDAPQVAVVNQALVQRYWPNENPIGKQLEYGGMDGDLRLLQVVGVAADVHDKALDVQPRPMVYVNYLQRPGQAADFSFVLRGHGDPASWIAAMRREARTVDPQMPTDFRTLEQVVSASYDNRRFSMIMLGVFAGAALALAMVGLYGIMSYITSQRTTEIGIRMALGAQRSDMLRMILRQSLFLAGAGMTAGILLSLGATRLLGSFLFGVGATDFFTYAIVLCLLGGAVLLASFIPAKRAMKVDPMVALRYE